MTKREIAMSRADRRTGTRSLLQLMRAGAAHLASLLLGRSGSSAPRPVDQAPPAPRGRQEQTEPAQVRLPARPVSAGAGAGAGAGALAAARAEAVRQGFREGVAKERARWAAILAAPNAHAHLAAAVELASEPTVSVEAAARVLAMLGPPPVRIDRAARNPSIGVAWTPARSGTDRMDVAMKRAAPPAGPRR